MKQTLILLFVATAFVMAGFKQESKHAFNYALDANQSLIEWSGASPNTSHQGSFALSSQGILVLDSMISGGSFSIPIASIKNFDLPKLVKPVLIKHLKSKDFFHIDLYPEAHFTITNVMPLPAETAAGIEGANVLVSGDFSMLGVTHPLSFPAKVKFEGERFSAEASFKIDRTKWGMTYAADPALENRHIYPEVDIHLKLLGVKK